VEKWAEKIQNGIKIGEKKRLGTEKPWEEEEKRQKE